MQPLGRVLLGGLIGWIARLLIDDARLDHGRGGGSDAGGNGVILGLKKKQCRRKNMLGVFKYSKIVENKIYRACVGTLSHTDIFPTIDQE